MCKVCGITQINTTQKSKTQGRGRVTLVVRSRFLVLSRKMLFLLSFVSIWTTDKEEKYVLQTNQRLRWPWQNEGKLCTDCVTWSPQVFNNIRKFSFLLVKVEGGGWGGWLDDALRPNLQNFPRGTLDSIVRFWTPESDFLQLCPILDTSAWFWTLVFDCGG